jgi:hypothetical protein
MTDHGAGFKPAHFIHAFAGGTPALHHFTRRREEEPRHSRKSGNPEKGRSQEENRAFLSMQRF